MCRGMGDIGGRGFRRGGGGFGRRRQRVAVPDDGEVARTAAVADQASEMADLKKQVEEAAFILRTLSGKIATLERKTVIGGGPE